MDLVNFLQNTLSSDQNVLQQAQLFLLQASQTNLPEFLKQLSDALRNVANDPPVRMQAGLQLKNFLHSIDPALKLSYQERWLAMPADVRNYVKENAVKTLGTEEMSPSTAAQCVAYIACVEIEHGLWPELMPQLVQMITDAKSSEKMKESALESVGYICQDINAEIVKKQANALLTAIVHSMRKEEQCHRVRLAATRALLNSIDFIRENFAQDAERNYIMQVVCESTQSEDSNTRVAALQCLVKIMSVYYDYMEAYMGQALFAITYNAMKSEVDEVSLQGIEFWSSVCDEEMNLAIELQEAEEQRQLPERTSRFYAKGALQYLAPIILDTLTKQDAHDDEDEWNPCKAAGVCLMLMAQCCENDVVAHVLPFVEQHISSLEWRFRDAAVMAIGCIMEGPDSKTLGEISIRIMPVLVERFKDESVNVRDSVGWTIGRVCEMTPEVVVDEAFLVPLLTSLMENLRAEPRVAANVCWALSSLSEAAYEVVERDMGEGEPETYVLSRFFESMVHSLLQVTDRADGNQANLRSGAYEALMSMLKHSPKDCYNSVLQTTLAVLQRLQSVLELEHHIQSSSDRSQFNDLQSLLCATLQSVLRRIEKKDAVKISDPIMQALFHMLASNQKAGGVQEDVMFTVSSIVEALGEGFVQYFDRFKPFLLSVLTNVEEYQVCFAAVGVVGDLSRAMEKRLVPHCDEIMAILCQNLGSPDVHRRVKPQILSVFGDIALALESEFKKYVEIVLTTLQQASVTQIDRSDPDLVEYLNELRDSCLEGYTGIIQGLKGADETSQDVALLMPHVHHMVSFLEDIARDEDRNEAVVSTACGLLGDLITTFGAAILPVVETDAIHQLLTIGRRSKNPKGKNLAVWATKALRKLRNSVAQLQQTAAGGDSLVVPNDSVR